MNLAIVGLFIRDRSKVVLETDDVYEALIRNDELSDDETGEVSSNINIQKI